MCSGIFFGGVQITGEDGAKALDPTGEPDNVATATLEAGEAMAPKGCLMAPPAMLCGLDLPSNRGRGLPPCAGGEGVGGACTPRDGVRAQGEMASAAVESRCRLLALLIRWHAGLGDGVGGKKIRVGVALQGVRPAAARVEGIGESAEAAFGVVSGDSVPSPQPP